MKVFLYTVLFSLYLRLVGCTTKIKYYGQENLPEGGFIYVFWHRRLAFLAYSHRGRGIKVLLSTSRDGEIIWRILKGLGFGCVRGTASRPSQARRAAIEMVRELRKGSVIAVTPDGPKGPPGKVKKGVPFTASKTALPVVPLSWAAKKVKIARSWDRLVLPLPFNRAAVVTGEPYYISEYSDIEEEARKIERLINETDRRACGLAEGL